ncbi:plasmid mobilization relaxosome protein MobC [Plantibacter sp. Mn2098]|uniref:plasmid mobilization relaxosome protein MobC n=1 Tax=Plantibacter sp. Mn2098 TaxID=3395266 RepID=UPI003BF4CBF2
MGKRRRDNVAGGRKHSHRVMVTPEEEGMLQARAQALHVTVPRLLIEAALSPAGETPADRRNLAAELLGVRALLRAVSNNVNQIAKHANTTGDLPANTTATVRAVDDLSARIDEIVRRV